MTAPPAAGSGRPLVWIGTSWKMNKTIPEARDYIDELLATPPPPGVQLFVLPAHTALAAVRDKLPPASPILLGAQDAHWAAEGAWTGAVSMRMVKDAGATIVEIGHSERRSYFGETDEVVAWKARAAVDHGLVPLICVGEPLAVREAGDAARFVVAQARAATALLRPEEIGTALVAYEPVWAIGAGGRPATPQEVAQPLAALAGVLADITGGTGCRALLYGGGVDVANAAGLLAAPHVQGLFVGRQAWQARGLRELAAIGAVPGGGTGG